METQPVYDDLRFSAVGIVGQDDIDWQNKPTFQQVAMFPGHRVRAGAIARPVRVPAAPSGRLPATGADGELALLALVLLGATAVTVRLRARS